MMMSSISLVWPGKTTNKNIKKLPGYARLAKYVQVRCVTQAPVPVMNVAS